MAMTQGKQVFLKTRGLFHKYSKCNYDKSNNLDDWTLNTYYCF